MENITFITKISPATGEEVDYVIIDRGNEEFTSMEKAVWDAQEATKETGTLS